jgi:hypothetical protein
MDCTGRIASEQTYVILGRFNLRFAFGPNTKLSNFYNLSSSKT